MGRRLKRSKSEDLPDPFICSGLNIILRVLKTIIFIYCLLLPSLLSGSFIPEDPDSISLYNIQEVVIEKNRTLFFAEDKKISIPDPVIMEIFANASLGEIMSVITPAYVNTSGSTGASSSVFFRGTNSYQTTVNWNGFLLNSITLGTMDFSSVPAAAVQKISVVHGASGSIAGSGNFGGSVLLESSADWDNRMMVDLKSEIGTYDNKHYSFSSKIGNPSVQYQVFLFSHQAENNFRYTDIYKNGDPVETIKNNSLDNKGIIQNLFLRLPGGNKVETGLWYQVKEKELPAIMGSYMPANAVQRDSSLRVYTRWTRTGYRSSFALNTAVFREYMEYADKTLATDEHYSIKSEMQTGRFMGDINYRHWVFDNLSVEGGITYSILSADITSYGQKVTENQAASITAMKLHLPGFTGNASFRKEFHENTRVPLLYSLGAMKEMPVAGMAMKASFSRQFRVPSFNDKYWQPGGNPALLPESGYTADVGLVQDLSASGPVSLVFEVSAYSSRISNMIQWAPSENNRIWTPGNKKEVSVNGIESSFASGGTIFRYDYTLGGSYNYSRSLIRRSYDENKMIEGKQLAYVPGHTGSAFGNITYKNIFMGFTGNFTGNRFTGEDNNRVYMMPAFFVLNSHAGYRLGLGEVAGRLQFRIVNLLNSEYQVVRAYPMPGRSFHVSFSIEFKQQQ
jgi:vitamin B12 transporter